MGIGANNINANQFEIWIELEAYAEVPDYETEEYCNVIITFSNGAHIGLNVWSEKFFRAHMQTETLNERDVLYVPDLVIHKLEPTAIRKVVTQLITEDKWLEGRGFPGLPSRENDE